MCPLCYTSDNQQYEDRIEYIKKWNVINKKNMKIFSYLHKNYLHIIKINIK